MAYGSTPWHWGPARLGWEFGFDLLPINIKDDQTLSAMVTQSAYSFNTGGIVPPTAPYNGGPSGIGPTIHDVATLLGTTTTPAILSGSRTLDVWLYALRLGPSVYFDLGRRFGLSVGAGPALGIVSGKYKFDETITSASGTAYNSGKIGGTKVVFGGYVDAMLTFHVIEGADFYVGAQFTPMGNATFGGNGRESRLDLGGQIYFSAGFNWPF
jgi:hypothetical protein